MPARGKRQGAGDWLEQAKIIGLIVLLILVVVVVVKNGQDVRLWIFGWAVHMPLFLMLAATFLLGLLAGAWGGWLKPKRKK